MKYIGMPKGMWLLFHRSFREEMVGVLGYSEASAAGIEKKALPKYKEIIAGLPEFEKIDRFKMNIVNCAMLAAFYLNMEFLPYPDGSGYEARFSKCGICTLMRELGISEIVLEHLLVRQQLCCAEAGSDDPVEDPILGRRRGMVRLLPGSEMVPGIPAAD